MALIIYKRQQQILDFLKQFIHKNGSAPTLRQIADAIGVSSLATVHEHLHTLEEKGLIRKRSGKGAIEIQSGEVEFNHEGFEAPILGFIAAGAPIEPYTDPNATMNIPVSFASGKRGSTYFKYAANQ